MKRAIGIMLFTLIIVNVVAFTIFFSGNNSSNEQISLQQNDSFNQIDTTLYSLNPTGNVVYTNENNNSGTSDSNIGIPVSELSRHNVESDCWVAYKGEVYDLTLFLPAHPGSARAITPYCGTSSQFEKAFANQHGTSQVKELINEGIYKGILK
ncbi:MAG: cytochrome b5 domain-containing protein [Ignavibacteriaceae bacterium]|nr:cytochrome b5 domain-containing protein [Ignavibacteriaceae bacterium]